MNISISEFDTEAIHAFLKGQERIIVSAFESMDQGISIVDGDLNLVAYNSRFLELLEFPSDHVSPGDSMEKLLRFNAERGDYGPGDIDEQVESRLALARRMEAHRFERVRPDGTIIEIIGSPLLGGGFVTIFNDVTERNKTSNLAKDAVAQLNCYRQALDIHVGVAITDTEGKFTHVNDRFSKICGYNHDELIGKNASILNSRHHDTAFFETIWQSISSGESWSGEIKNRRKDGSEFWVDKTIVPFKNENGEIDKYVSVSTDITERKTAEDAIRRSEQKFSSIAHALPLPFVILDIDHEKPIFSNITFRRIFSGPEDGTATALDPIFVDPANKAAFFGELRQAGRVRDYETQLRNHAGEKFWASISADIMRVGIEASIFIAIQDISNRKRSENAVREREKRLQGIMDAVSNGIITVNHLGLVETVNNAAEALFQVSKDEFDGYPMQSLFDDGDPLGGCALEEFLEGSDESDIRTVEISGRRKDGTVFPAEVSVRQLHLRKKRLLLVVVTDMTSRNAADSEKERLEQELRQSQKMEALGTLAGGVAHDINNTLVPVIALSELAIEALQDNDDLKSDLQDILDAGTHIQKLVEQILAYSRRDGPERRRLDLTEITKETLKLLRSTIPSTVTIVDSLMDEDLPIEGDDTQIHQALVNLFVNAADAMDVGTGSIEIASRVETFKPGELPDVAMEANTDFAILSVRDTGTGINQDILARVFDPFFTTKEVGEGTGLGLSVVHGVVTGHGGTVKVDSVLGEGTTFHLYFPLLDLQMEGTPHEVGSE